MTISRRAGENKEPAAPKTANDEKCRSGDRTAAAATRVGHVLTRSSITIAAGPNRKMGIHVGSADSVPVRTL